MKIDTTKTYRQTDITRMMNTAIWDKRVREKCAKYKAIICPETNLPKMDHTWIIAKLCLEFACSQTSIYTALAGSDNDIEVIKTLPLKTPSKLPLK